MDIEIGGRAYVATRIMAQKALSREMTRHIPQERILDEIAVELGRGLLREGLVEFEKEERADTTVFCARGIVLKREKRSE